MRYNYVIFGSEVDFLRVSYEDLNKVDYAKYLYRRIDTDNPVLTKLYQLHTSPVTNRFFRLPGQGIWNKMAFRGSFNDDKPICFLFFPRLRWLQNGIIEYLRKKYPDCKVGLYFGDLVQHAYPNGIEELKKKVDICLSFDHSDAQKYGMYYYPLPYSCYDIPADDTIAESDVYFVGKAKDRLDRILSAYEKFRDAGLKCEFYITGVDPEKQKYVDEIHYCGQMAYIENLKHVRATKALLEIMQQGGHGYTLRACEAIMYDKKMITDNPEIKDAPFYSPERISVFKDENDIEVDFVLKEPVKADYQYKEQLSPVKMLEFIDENL